MRQTPNTDIKTHRYPAHPLSSLQGFEIAGTHSGIGSATISRETGSGARTMRVTPRPTKMLHVQHFRTQIQPTLICSPRTTTNYSSPNSQRQPRHRRKTTLRNPRPQRNYPPQLHPIRKLHSFPSGGDALVAVEAWTANLAFNLKGLSTQLAHPSKDHDQIIPQPSTPD